MTKNKKVGVPGKPEGGNGKPKKEGWRERTKDLKTVIVQQPDFQGIVFMLGQVPLRKIGIQKSAIAVPGMPTHTIVNGSHMQAPPYRIIFTLEGTKCYVKGTPPVLIQ